jgi:hemoglobin-like flavoprotein
MALDVALLRSSFALVVEKEPELTSRFYDRLFVAFPQVRPMFSRNGRDAQEKMLRDMLVAVLDHLEDATWLSETLGALGRRHVDYGVEPKMYQWVGESLLATLADVAGPAWSPELHAAWAEAYTAIVSLMLSGVGSAR